MKHYERFELHLKIVRQAVQLRVRRTCVSGTHVPFPWLYLLKQLLSEGVKAAAFGILK